MEAGSETVVRQALAVSQSPMIGTGARYKSHERNAPESKTEFKGRSRKTAEFSLADQRETTRAARTKSAIGDK